MTPRFRLLRQKLTAGGLLPTGVLGRVTAYLLALDLLLFLVARLSALAGFSAGANLGGWINLLTFVSAVLLIAVVLRWVRRRLMWRLRNRLIVTYMFIGVMPVVLLLAMAYVATLMFTGQFAIFLANSDLRSELKAVQSANSGLAAGIAARLRRGELTSADTLQGYAASERAFPERVVTVWFRGQATVSPADAKPVSPPAVGEPRLFAVAVDDGRLYMRALRTIALGSQNLTVISSVPLDKNLLETVIGKLGRVTLSKSVEIAQGSPGQASPSRSAGVIAVQPVTAGALPAQGNRFDTTVEFTSPFPVIDWRSGETRDDVVWLAVSTRRSVLYHRLAESYGPWAGSFTFVLLALAIVLALVELFALVIGIRLTRTMTRSVYELYEATQRINRGDFRHRIQVKSQDQLAALETSFNSMTESLEKLLAEQKEKQRMENELAIAQEVQAQLFPQHVSQLASLEVNGVCRPARTVSGDYYDFLELGPEKLVLAVGDISGKGISAALLMATIHSAVRAYSLERQPALAAMAAGAPEALSAIPFAFRDGELSPAVLMAMLNRQLYASTPAEKYATMFIGIYDGGTRQLTYCNAGHLPPMIFGSDGAIHRLDCGGTVIGLFGGISYDQATIELRPGELLLAYSDGVTEPENEFGEFGEARLVELVEENRSLPLARVSDEVLAAVSDWIGGAEQPDDVTLVLARAR
jgi:sigma-B regulation protein RsbU (phosphoserine phosphatase)